MGPGGGRGKEERDALQVRGISAVDDVYYRSTHDHKELVSMIVNTFIEVMRGPAASDAMRNATFPANN